MGNCQHRTVSPDVSTCWRDEDERCTNMTTVGVVRNRTFKQASKTGQMSDGMKKFLQKSLEMDNVSDDKNTRLSCVKFYQIQSNQELGLRRITVPVYAHYSLHNNWKVHLRSALQAINEAAPGLYMYWDDDMEPRDSYVPNKPCTEIVVLGNEGKGCWTRGNIILHSKTIVSLDERWPEGEKKGTALHELMHALGFGHEHQRKDAERYLTYDETDLDGTTWKTQFQALKDVTCLSRFDPHSVMMYHHDDLNPRLKRKTEGDPVWASKSGGKQSEVLSELDKVCLNIIYRPVLHDGYSPKISSAIGLYYCGRSTFVDAERDPTRQDGVCGPENGANCAACRVLKTEKSEDIRALGKWQGWTGLVYCGRKFGEQNLFHDGFCGPDNGPPCEDCKKVLVISDLIESPLFAGHPRTF